ncbi:MAG: nitroreductase family deazaflavin-dependent oxidoreductase [Chloroflexi bacterium]|nr:nitroreductase family deazaflavin-dependent oxidoreductase [Chloroflexota bacterium]
MNVSKLLEERPQGLIQSIYRFPISLYRLGWGGILGWLPMLVMTTKGRRSGSPRHVMVEFRRHGSKYYVFSAWGERTDWYRNLLQHPRVTIQHGTHVFAADARPVQDNAEALRALYLFTRNSRLYERMFAGMSSAQSADLNSLADVAQEFTLVRLEPNDETPELPPVELYDEQTRQMAQILAIIFLLHLVLWLLRRR